MNQNNQRIAKNTIFLYVRLAIVMIVNLYTTRIVLNALGVEDYGIYNVVCGFVSMFAFLNASMTMPEGYPVRMAVAKSFGV